MPFNDGIPRNRCFSLTDFHDFDHCPFRFLVFHHLEKKYELSESSETMCLGTLLDESLKLFHKCKAYGAEPDYLSNLVKASAKKIREYVEKRGANSFHGKHIQFLTPSLIERASQIFKDYYIGRNKKIKESLGEVGFCEWVIEDEEGKFKLWGGPDAYELGEDGVPEVVDYKYRENIDRGKENMDMDLMPKLYCLLASEYLRKKGYKKARFVVRFWQDPEEDGFYEEFDIMSPKEFLEPTFLQKIKRIFSTKEPKFCEMEFCKACQSKERENYLKELQKKGFIVMSGEEFLNSDSSSLPF